MKIDENNEHKIVEEGFIHIISSNQEIRIENGTTLKVLKLLKYVAKHNQLFVYVKTNQGNKAIEIKIDEKRTKGTQLVFLDNTYNQFLDWVDLEKNISFLSILHFLCQILSVFLVLNIIHIIFKK